MYKLITSLIIIWVVYFNFNTQAQQTAIPQQGYSTSTLHDPIFDEAQIAIETMFLNNWLVENYNSLTFEQMKGPREHLYYLIDSHIKHIFLSEGQIIWTKDDPILQQLFYWAGPLGVFGGGLIYNTIKTETFPPLLKTPIIPYNFNLKFEHDLITIAAKEEGWEVKIPYYFMIGFMTENIDATGKRMQMFMISTGTALDKSVAGRSQATLLLAYSPDKSVEELSTQWKNAFGLNEKTEEKDVGQKDKKSLYSYDKSLKMHKELIVWQEKIGAFAVSYSGLDGTYQWNRQHFLDFLAAISIKEK